MSDIQKFKRGNLVTINKEMPSNMSHFKSGCDAIIIGSYADQYGGSDTSSYTLMFLDGGESSWYEEDQLTLRDEGGEHLIEKAKEKYQEDLKEAKSKGYIKNNLEKGGLGSASILHLFDLLGFQSSFLRNGEFYCLFNDWHQLLPAFIYIKKCSSVDEAKKVFKDPQEFNVEKVWNFLN